MATKLPTVSGISSRRSACDRCRGLKARCLRAEPQQVRCDRCCRTDSKCFTSPIFRVRRWQPPCGSEGAAAVLGSAVSSDKSQRRDSEHGQKPSQPPSSPKFVEPNLAMDTNLLDRVAPRQSPSWNIEWPDTNLLGAYEDGVEEQITATIGLAGSTFDVAMSESLFSTIPAANTLAIPSVPQSLASEIASSSAVTAESGQDYSPPSSSANVIDGCSRMFRDTEQTLMQRVSRLDYDLITILGRIGSTPQDSIFKPLLGQQEAHRCTMGVDSMLNATREFIDVLGQITDICLPLSPEASLGLNQPSRQDAHDTRWSVYSSNCSDFNSVASPSSEEIDLTDQPSPQKRQELDASSLLSILNVYIRLLRLYVMVFTELHDYLKKLSKGENPQINPVAGFSVGDTPIGESPLSLMVPYNH
ncbi:hypothetical protein S7711_11028 [Stachybotrys chartarum IBT 7711]|uniref:Zn(2)-C6 fungal-type domain-containing protein n=1 Tax=Stachybotrys chartarum (strain CBS 109288 / IBT 7711) TaxID=1280523 RepID=A0A084B500_STACB|nr:hypothetical protein S7711_11028 [Stachybotrys chartarum IBT 7711]